LTQRLNGFAPRFSAAYAAELRKKLGLLSERDGDTALIKALLGTMAKTRADYTHTFRQLSLGEAADQPAEWLDAWRKRLALETTSAEEQRALMLATNPAFIPRNHVIEHMIDRALAGDLGPFRRLNLVLFRPFDAQPETADLTTPPGDEQWGYRTFCGT
jgi:uncharacterized protein YdiU (UPF0061 family)